ncbi:unnamed protein product [Rodentolepis nana]|uniref:NOC3-like protein n=1 Tax=Rodentolepis nana TaxID=102285 RepID=A0A0R3T4Y6_RODNA|nr:unnamed protein product [Rodentolepis nana]
MALHEDVVASSTVQKLLNKRKYIQECKLKIANFSSSLMQDPNENIGRLRDLIRLSHDPLFMRTASLRQILVASLCVVFKDILPAYRIRLPTEEELHQRVKKETKRLWRYEDILLKNYEAYTILLRTILKNVANKQIPKKLRSVYHQDWTKPEIVSALKCACALFENSPLFNFSKNLLNAIIPFLQRSNSPEVRQIIFNCLRSIFASDLTGEATLMICQAIHRVARNVKYRIRSDLAKVIAGISLKEVLDSNNTSQTSKRDRKLASRKERKKDKLLAKFEKDQAETKASHSHEERIKMNTQILKEILFIYFTILKSTQDSELLSAVLAGLSTYAHIINVEYVENLLQLMSSFVANPKTGLEDGLHAVHTALTILNCSTAASILRIDPTRFSNHLYALLGRMAGVSVCSNAPTDTDSRGPYGKLLHYSWARTPAALAAQELAQREQLLKPSEVSNNDQSPSSPIRLTSTSNMERYVDVILSCLDMLLISRRREVSITRVLAFVKRLSFLSLVVTDTACLASMLVSLWKFLSLFPKCEVLFDSETEIGGVYDPEAIDPEVARPASASLWELQLLRSHESPLIRKIVGVILKWARQTTKDGTTRATNEVLVSPDHTIESLSSIHPSERRIVFAHAEASCLSDPVRSKAPISHRPKPLSPWIRELMDRFGLAPPGSHPDQGVVEEVAMEGD